MYCMICRKVNRQLSHHIFPKNVERRTLWLEVFNLREDDINVKSAVCALHFKLEDFVVADCAVKKTLKSGTVPSLHLSGTKNNRAEEGKTQVDLKENVFINILMADGGNVAQMTLPTMPIVSKEDEIVKKFVAIAPKTDKIIETSYPTISDLTQISLHELKHKVNEKLSSENAVEESLHATTTTEDARKEKRKIWRPAYVSQVDLETGFLEPKQAKLNFQLALDRIKDLTYKNRKLKRQNRVLLKKVDTLTCKLKEKTALEKKKIEIQYEDAPNYLKDLLQRDPKARKMYNEELKDFALGLKSISPKAYDYVRETFQNLLPHPSSLKKWRQKMKLNQQLGDEEFIVLTSGDCLDIQEEIIGDNVEYEAMEYAEEEGDATTTFVVLE